MKVTSNLYFLLCISSVVMPVVEASIKGFPGLSPKLSAATTRALKHDKALADTRTAVQVHQQHRGLQPDLTVPIVCNAYVSLLDGLNTGCSCTDGEQALTECSAFILDNCNFYDIVQGEEASISFSMVTRTTDSYSSCRTYMSGSFDNTICTIRNLIDDTFDDTCIITIDGEECSSCSLVDCEEEGESDYDIDCSNLIAGETWNFCNDIPETSLFIAYGPNEGFDDPRCSGDPGKVTSGGGGTLEWCELRRDVGYGCTCVPDGEDYLLECDITNDSGDNDSRGNDSGGNDSGDKGVIGWVSHSGGNALSFHALSVVGLISVAAFL
jgi:hypothetical protein